MLQSLEPTPINIELICAQWDCFCSILVLPNRGMCQTASWGQIISHRVLWPCIPPDTDKCEAKALRRSNSSQAWLSTPSQDSPGLRKGRVSYLKSEFYRSCVLFMAGTKVTVGCAGRAALLPVALAHNSPVSGCTEPAWWSTAAPRVWLRANCFLRCHCLRARRSAGTTQQSSPASIISCSCFVLVSYCLCLCLVKLVLQKSSY